MKKDEKVSSTSEKISLAAARVNIRRTQKDVAEEIGVSENTIRNWETGKSYPSTLHIDKLLELYHKKYENIDWFKY